MQSKNHLWKLTGITVTFITLFTLLCIDNRDPHPTIINSTQTLPHISDKVSTQHVQAQDTSLDLSHPKNNPFQIGK
ncbi:MAG TPA: hypothetical protein EYQ50_23280 [Verrucomicrobiales bacterium]|nr:hypothetical protein [Verrucomicrobiales bacterium]HIL70883.1 hypothetical protein [Verrucomicrobiota bacterium]